MIYSNAKLCIGYMVQMKLLHIEGYSHESVMKLQHSVIYGNGSV